MTLFARLPLPLLALAICSAEHALAQAECQYLPVARPWESRDARKSGQINSVCSGAFVDPMHVLTAAHCLVNCEGDGRLRRALTFTPARSASTASGTGQYDPYGTGYARKCANLRGFRCPGILGADPLFDIGIVRLDRPIGGLTLYNPIGYTDVFCVIPPGPVALPHLDQAGLPLRIYGYQGGDPEMKRRTPIIERCEHDGRVWWMGCESQAGDSGSNLSLVVPNQLNPTFAVLSGGNVFPILRHWTVLTGITEDRKNDLQHFIDQAWPQEPDLWPLLALDSDRHVRPEGAAFTRVVSGQRLPFFSFAMVNYSRTAFTGNIRAKVYVSDDRNIDPDADLLLGSYEIGVREIKRNRSIRFLTSAANRNSPAIPDFVIGPGADFARVWLGIVLDVNDASAANNVMCEDDTLPVTVTRRGACCRPGMPCEVTDAADCVLWFQGQGIGCDLLPCMGACYRPGTACFQTTFRDCLDQGGGYYGGLPCAEEQPARGACCLPNGDCVADTTLDHCFDNLHGTFFVNRGCDPNFCPQPPTGACCTGSAGCEVRNQINCENDGYEYLGDDITCDAQPCANKPMGACCDLDGNCVEVSSLDCHIIGGQYSGDGSTCDEAPCPAALSGACCLPDAECSLGGESECLALGGIWQGPKTDCAEGACGPDLPSGACCDPGSGFCRIISMPSCFAAGFVYQGDDVPCVPYPCEAIVGACCRIEICELLTSTACAAERGRYAGDGTRCEDIPCPPPIGACCKFGGECFTVSPEWCDFMGGQYAGDGATCPAAACPTLIAGACCDLAGQCRFGLELDCEISGFEFLGDGTICDLAPCDAIPRGVCCDALAGCSLETRAQCEGTGGIFLSAAADCGTAPCGLPCTCGDSNCDGQATVLDIAAFVQAIVDPAAWGQSHYCNYFCNDTNRDGEVSVADIGPFIVTITAGACP